ncbi:hypothetical protein GCM10023093_18050 [Nemorincola caseinilytica]|uniref:Uncharacterized protein n=1 Tax=Nemorincola caseinilytica TaxID=2054315 RepID=A0ABP8NE84_9BACT
MRQMLTECYALFFKVTRVKALSYWSAIAYLSILSFWVLKGLSRLTVDWISIAAKLQILFSFPVYVVTIAGLFFAIYKVSPKMAQISKDVKRKSTGSVTLIIMTICVVLLWLYMKFGDSFFS